MEGGSRQGSRAYPLTGRVLVTPLDRYRAACEALTRAEAAVTVAAGQKYAAIAEMRAAGLTLAAIGSELGITRNRVLQMEQAARRIQVAEARRAAYELHRKIWPMDAPGDVSRWTGHYPTA